MHQPVWLYAFFIVNACDHQHQDIFDLIDRLEAFHETSATQIAISELREEVQLLIFKNEALRKGRFELEEKIREEVISAKYDLRQLRSTMKTLEEELSSTKIKLDAAEQLAEERKEELDRLRIDFNARVDFLMKKSATEKNALMVENTAHLRRIIQQEDEINKINKIIVVNNFPCGITEDTLWKMFPHAVAVRMTNVVKGNTVHIKFENHDEAIHEVRKSERMRLKRIQKDVGSERFVSVFGREAIDFFCREKKIHSLLRQS